jgi:hypothetical protein
MADLTTTPDFTGVVNRSVFLAPLGGPQHPQNYLDRFPESLYNTAIDSRLVKFTYALLGPAGVGWLRKNQLSARLMLEDFGLELFDLDKFYANPLAFGRILEEVYDEDPSGLLPREDWEKLRSKDAQYRNRAIDFVNGARAGNTPLGMQLVARSGLGHEVEIIENYRYLYDIHSDDRLSLPYYGKTASTEEMIVLPRKEVPQSEVQTITILGSPTGGFFSLYFPVGQESVNTSQPIGYNAARGGTTGVAGVQEILEAVPSIGKGNIIVDGGPLPDNPIHITFVGALAAQDVPQLQAINALTGGTAPRITVTTDRSGNNSIDEVVQIGARDQRYAREAIGRIKPLTTIVTFGSSPGLRSTAVWTSIAASSEYQEVIRYVSGAQGVPWPQRDTRNWIEAGVEHEARRSHNDLQHHYRGFHNVGAMRAYGEDELPSNHIGMFSAYQRGIYPVLNQKIEAQFVFTADQALADYPEPLTVAATADDGDTVRTLINGIYPVEWQKLAGVPQVRYKNDQFWASKERATGVDYLEVDLGVARAVNYLIFETTMKPFDIQIDYDVLDDPNQEDYRPVTYQPTMPSNTTIAFNPQNVNPWYTVENFIGAGDGSTIYTRCIRIRFTRRTDVGSPFNVNGEFLPFSIEVRNLRIGRNTS